MSRFDQAVWVGGIIAGGFVERVQGLLDLAGSAHGITEAKMSFAASGPLAQNLSEFVDGIAEAFQVLKAVTNLEANMEGLWADFLRASKQHERIFMAAALPFDETERVQSSDIGWFDLKNFLEADLGSFKRICLAMRPPESIQRADIERRLLQNLFKDGPRLVDEVGFAKKMPKLDSEAEIGGIELRKFSENVECFDCRASLAQQTRKGQQMGSVIGVLRDYVTQRGDGLLVPAKIAQHVRDFNMWSDVSRIGAGCSLECCERILVPA
jgi:hypothetical protein